MFPSPLSVFGSQDGSFTNIDVVDDAPLKQVTHPNLLWLHGREMIDISSTQIRNSLKTNG